MPLNKYYGGHGDEVMSEMKSKYGEKKGKEVFYATANKRNQNPEDKKSKSKERPSLKGLKNAKPKDKEE